MKKLIPFLLALALAVTARGYSFSAPAESGQTLYFTITEGTNVKVVAPSSVSWSGHTAPAGSLVIPATVVYGGITYMVTAIDRMAFQECMELTSVSIPGSVVTIGQRAFVGDTLLTTALLGEGVQRIDMMAFSACTALDTIELPSSLTRIAVSAFDNTAYYNNPDNWSSEMVLTLGQWVIKVGNTATGTVRVHEGIVGVANSALLFCRYVDKVVLPSTLRFVGDGAFKDCLALDTLRLLCAVPPAVSDDSFDGITPLPVLAVPCSTAAVYDTTLYWRDFTIVEDPCSVAISEVERATEVTVVEVQDGVMVSGAEGRMLTVYDMTGRCVCQVARASTMQHLSLPVAGIYVMLPSEGRPIKISYSK